MEIKQKAKLRITIIKIKRNSSAEFKRFFFCCHLQIIAYKGTISVSIHCLKYFEKLLFGFQLYVVLLCNNEQKGMRSTLDPIFFFFYYFLSYYHYTLVLCAMKM